jgi:S1-C subfamily serine protease
MAEVLQNLSNDLAETVKIAGASIVRVEGRRRMPASGVVWSADGLIVTAHHVVERDENITIGLAGGETISAALVGRDPTTDIAVLRATNGGLTAANWADIEALSVGHLVLALGRPGKTVQATLGVISAIGDSYRTRAGGSIDHYVQTDVVMYPGFSGGPLVGADGVVLGLNSSSLARGVSVTLPTATVRRVVEALQKHGRVSRGFLGVKAQPVQLPEAIAAELDQKTGLLIAGVEADSPAHQGGLLLGDTIVSFGGESVRHMDDLLALLSSDRVGATVPVRVVRGGQVQSVDVTIGEHA